MCEEIKNKNAELADEAVEEVTGGYTPGQVIERSVAVFVTCPACNATYTYAAFPTERLLPPPCPHCGHEWTDSLTVSLPGMPPPSLP